jgi:hypothetical protein
MKTCEHLLGRAVSSSLVWKDRIWPLNALNVDVMLNRTEEVLKLLSCSLSSACVLCFEGDWKGPDLTLKILERAQALLLLFTGTIIVQETVVACREPTEHAGVST